MKEKFSDFGTAQEKETLSKHFGEKDHGCVASLAHRGDVSLALPNVEL